MIRLSTEFGRKVIFANVNMNNFSTSLISEQFLHNSQHTRYKDTIYKLYVTNIVTKAEVSVNLTYESKNVRGAYFSFEMGRDGLEVTEPGTYEYTINAMGESGLNDKIFELDRGLFHIFNNDTFEDNYINPSATTIPAVKVYKPA